MSEHQPAAVERHCDVAVIGGSAAGLAAAVQLGRQRRSVIVVDSGTPRNAPAAHMHGYLGREAISPSQLVADGRAEVRSYGGEVLAAQAERVTHLNDRFRVDLVGGHVIVARRVLAAAGLIDELPDIEGLAQHWGADVIHCPFCHGYEVRDRRIAQIVTSPLGLHSAGLFRQLTAQHTLVLHEGVEVDESKVDLLQAGGVTVVRGKVRRVVTADTGRVSGLELADGRHVEADAIVVEPRFKARTEPFLALGLQTTDHPSGLGDVVEVDATTCSTAVPGLYAAGNVTDPSHQVSSAAAHGSRTGAMIGFDLAHEDLLGAARPSGNDADWDHRYNGEQLSSGNPNGTLVHEATGLSPGFVLDVGAGEGGDALWLAEQGWSVTASDISRRALERITAAAEQRGLLVECLHADANALNAFPAAAFDLVSAQYASIPRTPDQRGVHSILDAVAPGGTLIVVSHDLEAMHQALDIGAGSRPFDADAFVRVDDFAAVLTRSTNWEIAVHEKRPRPPGAPSASHHVDDIVLRARRHPEAKPQRSRLALYRRSASGRKPVSSLGPGSAAGPHWSAWPRSTPTTTTSSATSCGVRPMTLSVTSADTRSSLRSTTDATSKGRSTPSPTICEGVEPLVMSLTGRSITAARCSSRGTGVDSKMADTSDDGCPRLRVPQ